MPSDLEPLGVPPEAPPPEAPPPAAPPPAAGPGGATQVAAVLRALRARLASLRGPSWVAVERILLACFVAGRASLIYQFWGQQYGHDAGFQMEVSRKVTLFGPRLGLRECFNCYQPPLGFLFPKWVGDLTGLEEIKAAQVVGFGFSMLAFFFFRATLRHLNLLHKPMGMALLYLSMAMPVMQYLAYGITLDSQMIFYACVVLWLSVKAFWPRPGQGPVGRRTLGLALGALVVLLAASTMVKYSGFLYFVIPGMVAVVQPHTRPFSREWLRQCVMAGAAGALALALVFPYYYTRYYKELGKFTPIAIDWLVGDQVEKNRKEIHANRWKFVVDLFSPTPTVKEHPDWNDPNTARLHDTWRFFWVRSHVLGWRERDWKVAMFYLDTMPWLILVGALMLWRTFRRGTTWARLGWVIMGVSLIQWASMAWYNYSNPFPLYVPIKAIYISPAAWGIAFILAHVLQSRWLFPLALARRWRGTQVVLLLCVGLYAFYNNHLALY